MSRSSVPFNYILIFCIIIFIFLETTWEIYKDTKIQKIHKHTIIQPIENIIIII